MNDLITLKSLVRLGDDPDRMIKWCMNVGLIADKYICPKCGEHMKLLKHGNVSDKKQWRCMNDGHDVKRSIRKGSWFENSRLSMCKALMLTHMWCMKLSNEWIMSELSVSSRTVCDWKNYCRDVCVECITRENDMLGGEGVIVEMYESKFGKRKYEGFVKGKWVFGGIERGTNKCFMIVVPERSKDVLLNVIRENVRPGSIIISEFWRAYNCHNDEGFRNLTVNHNVNFKDPETGAHTNSIVGTWATIKNQLNTNISKLHFDSQLYEYMWRRKHAADKKKLTSSFLAAVVSIYTPATQDD